MHKYSARSSWRRPTLIDLNEMVRDRAIAVPHHNDEFLLVFHADEERPGSESAAALRQAALCRAERTLHCSNASLACITDSLRARVSTPGARALRSTLPLPPHPHVHRLLLCSIVQRMPTTGLGQSCINRLRLCSPCVVQQDFRRAACELRDVKPGRPGWEDLVRGWSRDRQGNAGVITQLAGNRRETGAW